MSNLSRLLVRLMVTCSMLLLAAAASVPARVAYARPAGSTLIVNTGDDTDDTPGGGHYDSNLSLREAILLTSGNMGRCLSNGEHNQVSGANWVVTPPGPNCPGTGGYTLALVNPNVGSAYADSIVFDSAVTSVAPGSALPAIACNDNINGSLGSSVVRLDGTGAGSAIGIQLICTSGATANQVLNLEIRNFARGGVYGEGVQGGVFQGLTIYANGWKGLGLQWSLSSNKNPRNNQIGGTSAGQRNTIFGNGNDGIWLEADSDIDNDGSALGNIIEGNYIGVKPDGKTASANTRYGIMLNLAWGNTIGGITDDSRNLIGGNSSDGIRIEGANACGNVVVLNYIGVNAAGNTALGNGGSGVGLAGGAGTSSCPLAADQGNQIGAAGLGNVIGGNSSGIVISGAGSDGNLVAANAIGTNFPLTATLGNTNAGVGIYSGAQHNIVGGDDSNLNNTIVYNAQGVDIAGSGTSYNTIAGNHIGNNGFAAKPNGIGVRLYGGASSNIIGSGNVCCGSNLISGNTTEGVGLYNAGTSGNQITGNYIGTSSGGALRLGNGANGIIVQEMAATNVISGNLVSGNGTHGIDLNGSGTDGNQLFKNIVGLNANGTSAISNTLDGIRIEAGPQNTVVGATAKGNVISGNGNDGVGIVGASSTTLLGNIIGLNLATSAALPNRYSGVAIYGGSSANTVGDVFVLLPSNFISGNGSNGVYISGANGNYVLGNIIGNVIGNGAAGVTLYGGASGNVIGEDGILGNLINSNGGPGIDIANTGTSSNQVQGNMIGTDGTNARPNDIGVRIFGGASNNLIGGPNSGDFNLVSGNSTQGIGVYDSGTMTNTIQNNRIGLNSAGSGAVPNGQHGIEFVNGASANLVVSDTIAMNGGAGIAVGLGSVYNSLRALSVYSNTGPGIDLLKPAGPGCTSGSGGGNHCAAAPLLTNGGPLQAAGTAAPGAAVDIYIADGDASGRGEGRFFLRTVTADGSGKWSTTFGANLCTQYGSGARLTATSTLAADTSEFALDLLICPRLTVPLILR